MRIFGEAVIRIWSLLAKKVPAGQNEETAVRSYRLSPETLFLA